MRDFSNRKRNLKVMDILDCFHAAVHEQTRLAMLAAKASSDRVTAALDPNNLIVKSELEFAGYSPTIQQALIHHERIIRYALRLMVQPYIWSAVAKDGCVIVGYA